MKIRPDTISEQDVVYSDLVSRQGQYKVFDINDEGVYAIVRSQTTLEWVMPDFDMKENGTAQEQAEQKELLRKIMQPHFEYWHFSVEPYTDNLDLLIIKQYNCNLTEKDWRSVPAHVHKKRMANNLCDYFMEQSWDADVNRPVHK